MDQENYSEEIKVRLSPSQMAALEKLARNEQSKPATQARLAIHRLLMSAALEYMASHEAASRKPAVAEVHDNYGGKTTTKTATKRKVVSSARRTIYRDLYLGDAPAGMPCPGAFRPESWEETVRVETNRFPQAAFALRVRGESMIGIGINDGDILIFASSEQMEPQAGNVVAAHIDGEVTIKTLVKTNGQTTLRAENPKYPNPLVTKSSAVQGVMIGKL